MANFTGLSPELNLCVMERANSFGDLVTLTRTTSQLRTLFKRYNGQIIASVSRNYTKECMRFMRVILRAQKRQDTIVSSFAPGMNGRPLITYRVKIGTPKGFDPLLVIEFYHALDTQLGAVVELCVAHARECGYITFLFNKSPSDVRRLYTAAMWSIVKIIVFARAMDSESVDIGPEKSRKFYNPLDRHQRDAHLLLHPINEARMYHAIQYLNRLHFDELIAVGDILIITRNAMRMTPSDHTSPGTAYAGNRVFRLLSNYQTSSDSCAMLLLAHVWILIRERHHRVPIQPGLRYRLARFEVFEELAMDIDTRVLRGKKAPTVGQLPLVPRAHRMKWRDLMRTALLDVYEAVGVRTVHYGAAR